MTAAKMGALKSNHRIVSGLQHRGKPKPHLRLLTPEQDAFVREKVKGRTSQELADLVNNKFQLELTFQQIQSYKNRYRLTSGLDTKFKKGHIAFRPPKGVRYSPSTEFKKGHIPFNYRPVGSERINVEGYVEIKVAEPRDWQQKHRFIWEKHHGKIPANHCLVFLDGNKQNITLDNLALVSRGELATLNKNRLLKKNIQLSKSGILLAKLIIKTNKKDKEAK